MSRVVHFLDLDLVTVYTVCPYDLWKYGYIQTESMGVFFLVNPRRARENRRDRSDSACDESK